MMNRFKLFPRSQLAIPQTKTINPILFFRQFQSANSSPTSDDLLKQRFKSLESLITKDILNQESESIPTEKTLEALKICKIYQDSVGDSFKLGIENNELIKQSNTLISKILLSSKTLLSQELLESFFKLQPNFESVKISIKSFYIKNPKLIISTETIMTPFRRLIYDGQFQPALDLIQLTTGSERFLKHENDKLKLYGTYFISGVVGLLTTIHASIAFFTPELLHIGNYGIYGIYGMISTFLLNCGFMAGLAFSSKGLENGSLRFERGTLPHHWYRKVPQLKMCSTVLLADAAINGLEGFATKEVVSRVQKMGFQVNEPEQEVMLRQYWVGGGKDFVWCEPDLDPAEIIWWNHLKDIGVKKIWDNDYEALGGNETAVTENTSNAGSNLRKADGDDDVDDVELKLA